MHVSHDPCISSPPLTSLRSHVLCQPFTPCYIPPSTKLLDSAPTPTCQVVYWIPPQHSARQGVSNITLSAPSGLALTTYQGLASWVSWRTSISIHIIGRYPPVLLAFWDCSCLLSLSWPHYVSSVLGRIYIWCRGYPSSTSQIKLRSNFVLKTFIPYYSFD